MLYFTDSTKLSNKECSRGGMHESHSEWEIDQALPLSEWCGVDENRQDQVQEGCRERQQKIQGHLLGRNLMKWKLQAVYEGDPSSEL